MKTFLGLRLSAYKRRTLWRVPWKWSYLTCPFFSVPRRPETPTRGYEKRPSATQLSPLIRPSHAARIMRAIEQNAVLQPKPFVDTA